MKVCRRLLPALVLAACAAQGAVAQTPPTTAWGVDWGDRYCTLSRKGEGPAPAIALRVVPGTEAAEIVLIGEGLADLKKDKFWVALTPGQTRIEVPTERGEATGKRFLKLTVPPPGGRDFLTALAQAKEVRVEGGKEPLVLPLGRAGKAVAALRQCIDAVMTEWAWTRRLTPRFDKCRSLPTARCGSVTKTIRA